MWGIIKGAKEESMKERYKRKGIIIEVFIPYCSHDERCSDPSKKDVFENWRELNLPDFENGRKITLKAFKED